MKKIIILAGLATALFTSCKDKEDTVTTTTKEITETDTVGNEVHTTTIEAASSTKKTESGEVTIATGTMEKDTLKTSEK